MSVYFKSVKVITVLHNKGSRAPVGPHLDPPLHNVMQAKIAIGA